jgi:4,5-dihydroxyphthalate decarboxylase
MKEQKWDRSVLFGPELMGDNFWPYGVKANRQELELIMRYIHEQGLAKRRLKVEQVFYPSTLELSEA